MFHIFLLTTILFQCILCDNLLLPSVVGRLNKVTFAYPAGTLSERDLKVCSENSACSIIHKRFWLPPLIERLCRCPQRRECTWLWSEQPDNYTMTINNLSQMKFCSELSEIPKCVHKKSAIKIITKLSDQRGNSTQIQKTRSNLKLNWQTEEKKVTIFCNCQDHHYWKLKINSTQYNEKHQLRQQTYFCSKLKKCLPLDFCGYVRTDTYSIFYRCSCPKGNLCIAKDKTVHQIEEILYKGQGYKAFCSPLKL